MYFVQYGEGEQRGKDVVWQCVCEYTISTYNSEHDNETKFTVIQFRLAIEEKTSCEMTSDYNRPKLFLQVLYIDTFPYSGIFCLTDT